MKDYLTQLFKKEIQGLDETSDFARGVRRCIELLNPKNEREISFEKINDLVLFFGLDKKSRKPEIVDLTTYFSYILRTKYLFKFSEIGRILGKNHATIIYHIKRFDQIKNDKLFQKNIQEISAVLY